MSDCTEWKSHKSIDTFCLRCSFWECNSNVGHAKCNRKEQLYGTMNLSNGLECNENSIRVEIWWDCARPSMNLSFSNETKHNHTFFGFQWNVSKCVDRFSQKLTLIQFLLTIILRIWLILKLTYRWNVLISQYRWVSIARRGMIWLAPLDTKHTCAKLWRRQNICDER